MFLSCVLKKPDVDDDDLSDDDNHLKHDEEFLSRSERDIQGIYRFVCIVFVYFVQNNCSSYATDNTYSCSQGLKPMTDER